MTDGATPLALAFCRCSSPPPSMGEGWEGVLVPAVQVEIAFCGLERRGASIPVGWVELSETHCLRSFLGPAESLVGDEESWRHQQQGLAVFLSPGFNRIHKLPIPVPEESF